jgi:hypothetical protein
LKILFEKIHQSSEFSVKKIFNEFFARNPDLKSQSTAKNGRIKIEICCRVQINKTFRNMVRAPKQYNYKWIAITPVNA